VEEEEELDFLFSVLVGLAEDHEESEEDDDDSLECLLVW